MDKALEITLALTIVGATLAFGGVELLSTSALEVVLFLAVLSLLVRQTWRGRIDLPLPLWPIGFAVWAALELVPLPWSLVSRLSRPGTLERGSIPLAGALGRWATLSIYPPATLLALLKFLACLCGFLLAAYLFDSRMRKSILLRALVFLGFVEGTILVVERLTDWNTVFAFIPRYESVPTVGTYINRNHFAGLLEMTLPFVAGSAFYWFQTWSGDRQTSPGRPIPAVESSAGAQCILRLFFLAILIVAVLLSYSRGGILATFVSLVTVVLLAQIKVRQKSWLLAMALLLLLSAGYGVWVGIQPVVARFEAMQVPGHFPTDVRISAWKDFFHLVREVPLFGTGLGTFDLAARPYQTTAVTYHWEHADNDYLEFVSDTGLVGATLLFLPVVWLFGKMVASFLDDPQRYRSTVTLGCLGSALALLIHSVTDFNLQIPANALIYAVVLGVGYKTACVERREEGQSVARASRP